MKITNNNHVEQITWASVQSEVHGVNADLASNVDAIAGNGTDEPLFSARYNYGQLIVRDGTFLSPCVSQGRTPCEACKALAKAVAYTHIPLTLVLENCVEVFLEYKERNGLRSAPLRLLRKGGLFGVFETLDAITDGKPKLRSPWNVSSGARSVVMIAPVSNDDLQRPLARALNVAPSAIPWGEMKHDNWAFIRGLASLSKSPWHTNLLVFPKNWIVGEGAQSKDLVNFIFKLGWQQSRYLRDSAAAEALCSPSRKTRLHYYRTVLHLLAVGRGDVPAFEPVILPRTEAGPFCDALSLLSGVVSGYTPVILQPCHLLKAGSAGYYSISRPSLPGLISDGHAHIDDLIQVWNELQCLDDHGSLDVSETKQFVLGSAKHGSSNLHQLPSGDLFQKIKPGQTPPKLFLRSTSGKYFFTACLRVVRK